MSFVRSAIARRSRPLETRGADPRMPWGDSTPPPPSSLGSIASGVPVTQQTAEGIAAVYGCCALLADSVSSLPVELRSGPTRRESKVLPPSALLTRPYAEISARDWWVQFMWALALRGNFYGRFIEFDQRGYPVQIKPVHNDAVQVQRDPQTGALGYRFYGDPVPLSQVFHVRYQSTPGNIIGLNPIQSLALTFGNAIAQQRFVESFFLNSANPMGVIQVPGYLDRTETRKMLRGWLAAHQGLNSAHLPAVLTEGAEFKPITISPQDSQLLEALGFSEAQICGRIFRVPPHMVGIVDKATSWGRGIEQQERGYFSNTLVGYLKIGTESLTALHPPGQFVHFDTTARERGATLERAQAGALLQNAGISVADDIREWFDWSELPDGNGQESFVPINTQLLEQALLALKQMQEAPPPQPAVAQVPGDHPPDGPPNAPPNGKAPSRAEALALIERAVAQARRMQSAADSALDLGSEED